MYNYRESVKDECINAIKDRYTDEELKEIFNNESDDYLFNSCYDDFWVDDSITGNGSGSYTFNSYTAGENLVGNYDLLCDALREFGCDSVDVLEKGEEWCDVTIRCYLLGECLTDAIEELKNDLEV